jgi:signal transduction histidine kinase
MSYSAETATSITCPACGAQTHERVTICPTCGTDLTLLTILAEQKLFAHFSSREDRPPLSIELLVPRLGDYLVQRHYITAEQLQAALAFQSAQGGGPRARVGRTLVNMGALSEETLDQAIAEQILGLQRALLDANRELEKRVEARTAELEAALARLAEFNQLKANLVSNISHELRTPLTHIKGYNVLMRQGDLGPITDEQQAALGVTARSVARLEQLIDDLISFSAASKGELTLKLRPVNLGAILEQVINHSTAKAEQRQVRLIPQHSPELPLVLADEEKLLWTLLQLADNAIKFTPANGQVTVSATREDRWVRLAVQDTGIGIPPERHADIFEPFRQLDGSSTRRYGGTGLGLALVQRIVEAHGSAIKVESQAGSGSLFWFVLPRATAPLAA